MWHLRAMGKWWVVYSIVCCGMYGAWGDGVVEGGVVVMFNRIVFYAREMTRRFSRLQSVR
jgi:hypothetical protein